jgi:hypothetical protein
VPILSRRRRGATGVFDDTARVSRRPGLLLVGIRSRWDVYRVGLRGRLRYNGSIAGLVLGTAGLLAAPIQVNLGLLVGVTGVLLSGALLYPEWSGMRRGQLIVEHVSDVKIARAVTLDGGSTLVRHPNLRGEAAVVPNGIDEALVETRPTCTYTGTRAPLTPKVRNHLFDILTERVVVKTVFNGAIIRQDTDLTAELLRSEPSSVSLSRTDYFSMLSTNYMTGWRIRDRADGSVRLTELELILDDDRRLLSLAENGLANGIGASTLAFTADHRMVLIGQHRLAQSSAENYAPAGSGSVDVRDVRWMRDGRRAELKVMLAHAMRRELCEECNIAPRELGLTEVLGYFRWLNMGAKPEYTGITRINLSSDELRHRTVRVVETRYVREIDVCRLDVGKLRVNPDSLACLEPAVREKASVPLYMCLRSLGHALNRGDQFSRRLALMVGAP